MAYSKYTGTQSNAENSLRKILFDQTKERYGKGLKPLNYIYWGGDDFDYIKLILPKYYEEVKKWNG